CLGVPVADTPSMVRAGVRMLLADEPDIDVVAEASNGLEAVQKAARFDPTVILMDIRMPELDGLEATRRVVAADQSARVLIVTTFDLDEYVYEALRAGASGFVLKDEPPERLIAGAAPDDAGGAPRAPDRGGAPGRRRGGPAVAGRHQARHQGIPPPSAHRAAGGDRGAH